MTKQAEYLYQSENWFNESDFEEMTTTEFIVEESEHDEITLVITHFDDVAKQIFKDSEK